MPKREPTTTETAIGATSHEWIFPTIELLERLAADWSLLDELPAEDRARLHRAIAGLSAADPRARRKRAKQADRERRERRISHEEAVLNTTGIRTLRRRPIVTTPNVFPPVHVGEDDIDGRGRTAGGPGAERLCYVCKDAYSQVHDFYDQLCPSCADFNFSARTELADLRGRVAGELPHGLGDVVRGRLVAPVVVAVGCLGVHDELVAVLVNASEVRRGGAPILKI
jgi:hypothetical protein